MPTGPHRTGERHDERIKKRAPDPGESERRVKETAARTVDKRCARTGNAAAGGRAWARGAPRAAARKWRPGAAASTAAPA
ncbi:hypothetical protein [Streptomyces sp. NPDC026673]|uniref:hypothetical protein n=1 Tax=Streptomyces sp. NPDC026673 TaxID=3155724 RepID=UPI0034066D30